MKRKIVILDEKVKELALKYFKEQKKQELKNFLKAIPLFLEVIFAVIGVTMLVLITVFSIIYVAYLLGANIQFPLDGVPLWVFKASFIFSIVGWPVLGLPRWLISNWKEARSKALHMILEKEWSKKK